MSSSFKRERTDISFIMTEATPAANTTKKRMRHKRRIRAGMMQSRSSSTASVSVSSVVVLLSLLLAFLSLQEPVLVVAAKKHSASNHLRQEGESQRHGGSRNSSNNLAAATTTIEERRQAYEQYYNTRMLQQQNQNTEPQPRIFGGWDAIEDRYSYAQVSLERVSDGHQCGGSLIAVDVIVTAAHCAGSYDRIVIGKYNLYDSTGNHEIFAPLMEIVHPLYDQVTTRFDVMLIVLDGWTTLVTPVRVNTDVNVPANGQDLSVMGWGYDENWELPENLQETEVYYTRNMDCITLKDARGHTLENDLYEDMICAGDVGRDSCYGDSGSPLILVGATKEEDVQVGLVSWGYECAGGLPGIYSRLAHWQNRDFIRSTVCKNSIRPPTTYMDCGNGTTQKTNAPVTDEPTPSPTHIPTFAPTEARIAVPPPTLAPTTEELGKFLQGTSAESVEGTTAEEQQQPSGQEPILDDAYFFDGEDEAGSVNSATASSSATTTRYCSNHSTATAVTAAATAAAILLLGTILC